MNDYFIQQSTLDNPNENTPNVEYTDSEFTDIILTHADVHSVIIFLDNSKATGPDMIHNKLLIATADIITEPLTILFNRCLNEGIFPNIWKFAHVTPLHKKGPENLCNNYRPISLLSCVGKVLERCVHSRVLNYLKVNEIITQSQSGFMPGDSTVNQLTSIYHDLCTSFDFFLSTFPKPSIECGTRDYKKKIEAVGIRGNLALWFQNYLQIRKQAVVIKGKKSEYKTVPSGVPQGSVLGPLLLLIYINDITKNIESVIKTFADDTSVSLALKDPDRRAAILNSDFEKINSWAKRWKVSFNEEKTELLTFKKDNLPVYPLSFGNIVLEDKECHKHLGLTFQSNCKWEKHINSIIRKVTLLISCLRSFKYKLCQKALDTMYKSFILPQFDYADIVWDNCSGTLSNMLENLHLEAIRIILGAVRGTSHEKLYKESGFFTLKERRKRHKLLMFHKMINHQCPGYLSNLVPPLVSTTNPYH